MKRVTIMRGIPGSGKSSWVKDNVHCGKIISADFFFTTDDGGYRFDREMLSEAHNWCLREFLDALSRNFGTITVDNTNVRAFEIAPYYRLAEVFGYEVEVVWLVCDPVIAANRCIHGVPIDSVKRMSLSFDPLPSWWNVRIVRVV